MAQQKVSHWGFTGLAGMACVLFLPLGTATIAPWRVTLLLLLLWLVSFVVALRWFEPRPRRVPWLAALVLVVWLPTIVLGTSYAGWR